MTDTAIGSESDRGDGSIETAAEDVFENAPDAGPTVREFVTSGGLSTVGGLLTLGRGAKALRRGRTGRGLLGAVAGGVFVAIGIAQLRSRFGRSGRDVDETDVVGGCSDIEDVSSGIGTGESGESSRDTDPTDVTEAGSDIEDVDALGHEEDDLDRGGTDPTEIAETGPDIEDVGGRSDAPDEGGDRRDEGETEVVDEDFTWDSTGGNVPGEAGDRGDEGETEVVDEDLDGESTGADDHHETETNDTEEPSAESRHD